jgi:hypothetical protein
MVPLQESRTSANIHIPNSHGVIEGSADHSAEGKVEVNGCDHVSVRLYLFNQRPWLEVFV